MRIKQVDDENIIESFAPMGGYYLWPVHFVDGSVSSVEIKNDDISDEDIAKHFGKEVSKVDRNWRVITKGGQSGNDEWHREQDRLDKSKAKNLTGTGQIYEAGMSGINRAAPATDVSYEKVLNDVKDKWKGQTTIVKELSTNKLSDYKDAASSEQSIRHRPLRKLAKTVQGVSTATRKIDTKTAQQRPKTESTYESRLQEFVSKLPNTK